MQPYQEEYIENCRIFRNITSMPFLSSSDFDAFFEDSIRNMHKAHELAQRSTQLLQENLLPVLDDLHLQKPEVLEELESFADALTQGPQALDVALACQLHESLLTCYRHSGQRENVIRELYKLGMSRYGFWVMLTGLELSETEGFSLRMRYCFVEAGSYLKYFDEFREDTKGYILRSLANTYLGDFADWREKLRCVRRSMQVFSDEQYRASAPGLPWDRFIYLLHRQMVSVLPYHFPEGTLSPDAVVDVMESAHLIYELQYEKAKQKGEPLHAHRLMPYYSVEYACGLITKEELLSHMEELMDSGDPAIYDDNNNYRIISMPAYYVQYLRYMPDMAPPRHGYISQLYRRLLSYVRKMPTEKITDQTKLYLRQTLASFLEIKDGVSYREVALEIMVRFAPELYAHGYTVGKMGQALCRVIMDDEPDYFDDIPSVKELPSAGEKRKAMEEMVFNAGMFHDMGKVHFTSLYHHAGRQMLRSEEEALELHTLVGYARLKEHESTKEYADAAYGHHRWYDGNDGYPAGFKRKESPYRSLVDLIAFADYLDFESGDVTSLPVRTVSFEEKIRRATDLEGRRFSPLVTGWLRTPDLLQQLKELYLNGRREGFRQLFLRS